MNFSNGDNRSKGGYGSNGHANNDYNGIGRVKAASAAADDPDEIDLKHLFYTLLNHKWVIAGSILVCSVLAGIAAYMVTPIYQSEGSLLISESNNPSALSGSDLGSLLSSTYGIGMGSTIGNELQILRSRKLATEIADTLMKRPIMENGRQFPVLFRAYPDDSMMTSRDTVAARLQENISFSQVDREANLVRITYASPSPLEAAFVVNTSMDIYSQLSTRQNRMSAHSAVNFLRTERNRIEKKLAETEERLRNFMNEHRLVQVDAQTEELIRQMAALEAARQEARVKLVAIDAAIGQYNERLNSIKPGLAEQYADAIGPNVVRLQYQLAEFQIKKMKLLANNPGLDDQPNPPRELVELNHKIDLYKGQIRELTEELLAQGDQYLGFLGGADGSIAASITEMNQKLIELKVEQQQYKAQTNLLTDQLEEQERFFNNLPDNMIELARLKREVTISEELFLTVSKQYAEMALWEQTQFGMAREVDTGLIPREPIKPNKKLFVLVGFVLGGILSVGYVFVREAFNTTIDGTEKLKKRPLPLLSVVPLLDDPRFRTNLKKGQDTVRIGDANISSMLVTMIDSISPSSESFRRLQSNIVYSDPGKELKTIMVTSPSKGEGKSTTCANLAVSLSEMGKDILIVDLDLRRPNVHNLFGLSQSPGVFDVLFEKQSHADVIQKTVAHGVDLLAAGQCPPNPPSVLQSKELRNLLDSVRKEYDFVLLDTAPFGIITDAASLAREADGTIIVTRFNETHEEQLDFTLEGLKSIHADVLGTVLVGFDYSKSNDGHKSQHYRYSYQAYKSYENEG